MKSTAEAERVYYLVVSNTGARSIKYVITHYCGYEVAGKANVSRYASWARFHKVSPEKEAEEAAKANFNDETKILEEMSNGK
jgi:acetate kinase